MNILLIEDNMSIIKGLIYSFKENNYNLDYVTTVKDSIDYLNKNTPNLIILDITLPDGNGFDLFKDKILKLNIPTIFLTAKDDELDIVKGLNIGGEDYITKPFSIKELMARINKILLRAKKQNVIKVQDITFDIDKQVLYRENKKIDLTALELKIINLLFNNINKVVTRDMILDKIWEWTGNDVDNHTVTVYLKRIRQKIETNIITTIKGIGYRIDEE